MKAKFSKHDDRQIALMRERLSLYERGEMRLATLVGDLDFLIGSLESVDDSVRESLRREWSILEEVSAVALDRGIMKLDSESELLVARAVRALRKLV
jgi:hypothetical protein